MPPPSLNSKTGIWASGIRDGASWLLLVVLAAAGMASALARQGASRHDPIREWVSFTASFAVASAGVMAVALAVRSRPRRAAAFLPCPMLLVASPLLVLELAKATGWVSPWHASSLRREFFQGALAGAIGVAGSGPALAAAWWCVARVLPSRLQRAASILLVITVASTIELTATWLTELALHWRWEYRLYAIWTSVLGGVEGTVLGIVGGAVLAEVGLWKTAERHG